MNTNLFRTQEESIKKGGRLKHELAKKKYYQGTSTFIVLAGTLENDCAPKARQSKQLWNELRWIYVKLLRVLGSLGSDSTHTEDW